MAAFAERLDGRSAITVSAYVGQDLRDWRPGRDHRTTASATQQAGGGVLRDLSHELDYLLWLFGPWQRVAALGGAYGARAQWRVLRGERLAAARDGKRIKDALEHALIVDPNMQEAYFGIGLYHYYADVAPTAAKILRWLLLLPGGDRTEGMEEMLRAREHGTLLRDEADYQLQVIDLWYEKQPQHALELLNGLRDRHPRNPLFPQLLAQVQDVYLHDLGASLRTWRTLFDAARAHRMAYPELAETRARLGMASIYERMQDTSAAIEQLRAVIAAKPLAPFGSFAQAERDLARLTARAR
jgi:hypothetical protein